jgi:hypothetical protein
MLVVVKRNAKILEDWHCKGEFSLDVSRERVSEESMASGGRLELIVEGRS